MSKVLLAGTLLVILSAMTLAGAIERVELISTVAVPPVIELRQEIQRLEAEITAAKQGGLTPDPVLYARLAQLRPSPQGGSLDQGGWSCETATVIPSLPFDDTGALDATDDCGSRPYQDIFYVYTVEVSGLHTFHMCGENSAGDTYIKVFYSGTCCSVDWSAADDNCPNGGMDGTIDINLTAGQVVYVECGVFSWPGGTSYEFHAMGPQLSPPGDVCVTAIVIPELPYSITGQSTDGFTNDYAPDCIGSWSAGRDVVYLFTLMTSTFVQIALTNTGEYSYPSLTLFNGCPDVGDCIAYDLYYTGDLHIWCMELPPGQYYILVDNWTFPDHYSYDLSVSECVPCDPPSNDVCALAVTQPVSPGSPAVFNGTNCGATENDCFGPGTPVVWESFSTAEECALYSISFCSSEGDAFGFTIVYPNCSCQNGTTALDYNWSDCPDGQVTVFYQLTAGTYWLPIHWSMGPLYTVTVTYVEPCAPPFECHVCEDPHSYTADPDPNPAIIDFQTTGITVNVPLEYHIIDVDVAVDLDHANLGDLLIDLISPSGTTIRMHNASCMGFANMSCMTWDDEAVSAIGADCNLAPFEGLSFRPYAALSAFDGENAMGDWTLTTYDQHSGDAGSLHWFCLTFEYDHILAVELAEYEATPGDHSVTLSWTTASESDNDHFTVVRDGEQVGLVTATGTSSGATYYFDDRNLTNGIMYEYRVLAEDINQVTQELFTISATPNAPAELITEYALHQNYPNPFNPETNITFDLLESGVTTVTVFNLMGREVATLVNRNLSAGRHSFSFDATSLPSGVYLYKLNVNAFSATRKMVLMK